MIQTLIASTADVFRILVGTIGSTSGTGKSNHRKPIFISSAGNQPGFALPTLLCEDHLLLWNCSYPRSQGQCQRPVFLHSISWELPQKYI